MKHLDHVAGFVLRCWRAVVRYGDSDNSRGHAGNVVPFVQRFAAQRLFRLVRPHGVSLFQLCVKLLNFSSCLFYFKLFKTNLSFYTCFCFYSQPNNLYFDCRKLFVVSIAVCKRNSNATVFSAATSPEGCTNR